MSDNLVNQAEQAINSYQAKTGTGKQSDSGGCSSVCLWARQQSS